MRILIGAIAVVWAIVSSPTKVLRSISQGIRRGIFEARKEAPALLCASGAEFSHPVPKEGAE